MRQDAIEAIDRLKPYKGGNEALWLIHSLDNIDKHRLLLTVGTENVAQSVTTSTLKRIKETFAGSYGRDAIFPYSDPHQLFEVPKERQFPLESGHDLRRLPPDSEVDEQMQFSFDVTFGERGVIEGRSVLDTLNHLGTTVNTIVLTFRDLLDTYPRRAAPVRE